MPSLSLIIPAYNEEQEIASCLREGIKNSGGKFKEIVVVDNASTDKTAEMAGAISGVRVVREEKKGITRARQKGFEVSSGEVLAYVDADTRMPAGWAALVEAEFARDAKLACLSGPYIYYDLSAWKQSLVWLYWHLFAYPTYLVTGYMAVGGNFAIRRSVLERMHGFDTSIEFYGEDTDIARRASRFGKVKFSLDFVMLTSGRRLTRQGLPTTAYLYVMNFLSEVVLKRPAHRDYNDIR